MINEEKNKIPSRFNYNFINYTYDITREQLIDNYLRNMYIKTQSMFIYKNLPSTIPAKDLEFMLQCNGYVVFTKVNDNLYCFSGGLGGVPNEYYLPTICTVANPYLNYNKNIVLDVDGVLMLNDAMYNGLQQLNLMYAQQMADAYLSLKIALINSRMESIITVTDDNERMDAETYLKNIKDGKIATIKASNILNGDSVKINPYATSVSHLKDIIESIQYLKASWYNEIGINANYNMKREAINENEANMNVNALLPLIDNMLEQRKNALLKINEMYGTNITVEKNGAWLNEQKIIDDTQEAAKEDVEND